MSRSKLQAWRDFVASFGCMVCAGPAEIHHPRGGSVAGEAGGGRKSGEAGIIPLCPNHHRGADGIHQIGVETWERRFGTQESMRENLTLWTAMLRERGLKVVEPPEDAPQALPRYLPRRCAQ